VYRVSVPIVIGFHLFFFPEHYLHTYNYEIRYRNIYRGHSSDTGRRSPRARARTRRSRKTNSPITPSRFLLSNGVRAPVLLTNVRRNITDAIARGTIAAKQIAKTFPLSRSLSLLRFFRGIVRRCSGPKASSFDKLLLIFTRVSSKVTSDNSCYILWLRRRTAKDQYVWKNNFYKKILTKQVFNVRYFC
jgi:hypothetical protein